MSTQLLIELEQEMDNDEPIHHEIAYKAIRLLLDTVTEATQGGANTNNNDNYKE
jgi:hypothetical protein